MNIFSLFRSRQTAPVARDRLQILLAHERTIAGGSDLVALLREEILAVIKKHVSVDAEKVIVKMDRGDAVSTLEVDIEIPTQVILAKPLDAAKPLDGAKAIDAPKPADAVKPAELAKPAEATKADAPAEPKKDAEAASKAA